jgi:hypothetical protein
MTLMDLTQDDQWHRQVLVLVERAIEFDRLFGGRHALIGAFVRESATGDGQIGQKTCLETEIADPAGDFQATPAYLDRSRRIDRGVERAKIGVATAGSAEKSRGFGNCDASFHFAYRLRALSEARQRDPLGVERFRNGSGRFGSGVYVGASRHRLSMTESFVRPSRGRGMVTYPKRETAALVQEVRLLDGWRICAEKPGRLGIMRLRFVSFAGVPK